MNDYLGVAPKTERTCLPGLCMNTPKKVITPRRDNKELGRKEPIQKQL